MRASDYKNFKDFCTKNNFTPVEGLRFLEKELDKLKEKEE